MVLRPLSTFAAACAATWTAFVPWVQEPGVPTDPVPPDFASEVVPVLEEHCSFCHEGDEAEAGVDFSVFFTEAEALARPELWRRVALQLHGDAMPPPEERARHPAPSAADAETVVRWVRLAVDPRTSRRPPHPWAPALRRLTRLQYRNAVRDLFGVELPADLLPEDGVALGFDTVGGASGLSAGDLERLEGAARFVAHAAVAPAAPPEPPVREFSFRDFEGGHVGAESRSLWTRGALRLRFEVPTRSRYGIRVVLWGDQAGAEPCSVRLLWNERALGTWEVPETRAAPRVLECEAELPAGPGSLSVEFLNDFWIPPSEDGPGQDRNLHLGGAAITGPLTPRPPTAFQRELAARSQGSDDRERAVDGLVALAHRAWRGRTTSRDRDRFADLVRDEPDYESAVRLGIRAILLSPRFLFLLEPEDAAPADADGTRALTDHELATRLALFLWSSLPDAELLGLADAGRLRDPDVLAAQADRMIRSPRIRGLAEGFAAQWLQLGRLDRIDPDPESFPEWSPELKAAMREESLRLFLAVLEEDRDLRDLIAADFTYVDARLARHYGLSTPEGPGFHRVSLADRPRRGILGQAAILTLTSMPTRTSPVRRGAWILDNLLGADLPPPPANVGALDGETSDNPADLRERLARHRRDARCSVCHDRMDPLGFGLESYDPLGRERNGVDDAGVLPDGRSFRGPLELVSLLRDDPAFPRALAEKLLVHAIGRGLRPGDARAVEEILAGLDPERPTLRAMCIALVGHPVFRRRAVETTP